MPSTLTRAVPDRAKLLIPAMFGLLLLGDWLFWQMPAGLSLVLFAWAVFAVAAALQTARRTAPALLLLAASLPALDHLQLLSLLFLFAGLTISVAWLSTPVRETPVSRAARIAASLPSAAIRDILDAARAVQPVLWQDRLRAGLRGWAFPFAGALLLLALLTEANPVLGQWFQAWSHWDINWARAIARLALWTALGGFAWGFLRPTAPVPIRPPKTLPKVPITSATVGRALLLFNLVLAVQIGLDTMVILAGAELPDGLTYAEYARRGAFPLMWATILGVAFAMVARPHLGEGSGLRALLMLWLLQNLLMTLGAGFRLTLYVEAYGLTYLRLHAGIGMGVIAGLLCLIFYQILRDRSVAWVTLRGGLLGLAVLYAACFVNFADLIARQNIARGGDVDWRYLSEDLPQTARATLVEANCPRPVCFGYRRAPERHAIEDWREWGFRRWRVDRRIETLTTPEDRP